MKANRNARTSAVLGIGGEYAQPVRPTATSNAMRTGRGRKVFEPVSMVRAMWSVADLRQILCAFNFAPVVKGAPAFSVHAPGRNAVRPRIALILQLARLTPMNCLQFRMLRVMWREVSWEIEMRSALAVRMDVSPVAAPSFVADCRRSIPKNCTGATAIRETVRTSHNNKNQNNSSQLRNENHI